VTSQDTILQIILDIHPAARSYALTPDTRLIADLGMASVELIELVERVEDTFGTSVGLEELLMSGPRGGSLDVRTLIAWLDSQTSPPRLGR
jgi:acyl carrier protein